MNQDIVKKLTTRLAEQPHEYRRLRSALANCPGKSDKERRALVTAIDAVHAELERRRGNPDYLKGRKIKPGQMRV